MIKEEVMFIPTTAIICYVFATLFIVWISYNHGRNHGEKFVKKLFDDYTDDMERLEKSRKILDECQERLNRITEEVVELGVSHENH
jgi:membrane protein DedA with SNARE-associated domain